VSNLFYRTATIDPLSYGQQSYNPLDYAGAIGRFYTVGLKYRFL
jgi:iron complex outermembrane receptor protein